MEDKTKNLNLRKKNPPFGTRIEKSFWTEDNIIAGLNKFREENGRYPTSDEINAYEYLPSARQIQRNFGGLVKLRSKLSLDVIDYSNGESRSKVASIVNPRANAAERELERILVKYFGEPFVHAEKPLYNYFEPKVDLSKRYKNRADFFIYAKNCIFCVDLFVVRDIYTLIKSVNIKEKKYSGLRIPVYFVYINPLSNIEQGRVDSFVQNKKNKLDANIKILSKDSFLNLIIGIAPIKT